MSMKKTNKGTRSVSLAQIALEAGVSRMTASRVLRGADGYSEATRVNVLAVADRLDYVPNRIAAALGSDSATSLVAIALPTLGRELYSEILEGLENSLTLRGYQPIIGVVGYDDEAEYQWINSALAWRPCGLIVPGRERCSANSTLLQSVTVPVVEIWNLVTTTATATAKTASLNPMRVGIDHYACGLQMGEYLKRRYRGDAGYVGVKINDTILGHDRLKGFSEGFGAEPCTQILNDRSSFYAGYYGTEQLLSAHPDIRLIYYLDDNMAVGGMFYCQQKGMKIPGDIAIAGFGGLDIGSVMEARLTTTRVRRLKVGKCAADKLIRRLNSEPVALTDDIGFELITGATA